MGCTIQAESTLERNFLLICEYNSAVLEMWDQPERVSITFVGANDRLHRTHYTTDFLVIGREELVAYQVKPRHECERLAKQRPGRWRKSGTGFEDLAADEAFRVLGIDHKVVTEDSINPITCENLALLLQARRCVVEPDFKLAIAALAVLAKEHVVTLGDLLRRTGSVDATQILRLIDQQKVAALLDRQRLAEPDDALVGTCQKVLVEVADARSEMRARVSIEGVTLEDAPTVQQLVPLVERRNLLAGIVKPNVTDRTFRRWRQRLKKAGGNPLALVPQTHKRGNRERRASEGDLMLMHEAIASVLLVPNPPKPIRGYYTYVKLHAERIGVGTYSLPSSPKPVSLNTFLVELSRIPAEKRALAQGGHRGATAMAAPIAPRARALTPLRAFERAHIDHYFADQHAIVGIFGKKRRTRRVWLSVMVDQATQVVLGMSLSFRDPSRRACASVMRDCVRRHGRLPETIVVDNGSDFQSVYFEVLLARYGVSKQDRPPGDPRFGGQIEAVFHGIKEELILSLRGSTANDQRGRSISRSHRGQEHACWTLHAIYEAYERYFLKHYNLKVRPGTYTSADHRFTQTAEAFGCSGVPVSYDQIFIIASAVPLKRPLHVDSCRGVRHLDRWYFHTGLLALGSDAPLDALEEPWNDRCIYVAANGSWLPCFSGPDPGVAGFSDTRMFESIVYLENRDLLGEIRTSQYLRLEQQLAESRAIEAIAESEIKIKLRGRRSKETRTKLPAPEIFTKRTKAIEPFDTQEGSWDGYREDR
jgi:transposase InsO family protein